MSEDINEIKVGDKLAIHCYKHDGRLHQLCDEGIVLDIDEEKIVVANNKAKLTEADGRSYHAKEPAILFFYKKHWFNIIGQLKKFGLFYYCNIATPYIIDGKIIKYIDYDLDLRIFPNGSFKILDRQEYKYHKKKMNYSDELDVAIRSALSELITDYQKGSLMFDSDVNLRYEEEYQRLRKK